MVRETIAKALAPAGLVLRGGFAPEPADALPVLSDGRVPGTLLLIGNAGPALYTVDVTGRNEQRVPSPSYASDPAWSPLLR